MIKGPHDDLPEDQLAKASGMVSNNAKRTVGAAFPDRGIHAFLIQHAYANVSAFIDKHDITFLDNSRVLAYIESGFRDAGQLTIDGPARTAAGGVDGRTTSGTSQANPATPHVGPEPKKGSRGRSGGNGRGQGKGSKDQG